MKNLFKNIVIKLLTIESKLVIKKYKPRIVAVTGTVGKTSTKDAIYTALSKSFSVRKTKKSQNSEIGIPLTILECSNPASSILGWFEVLLEGVKLILMPHHYPEWLILEIGADHPGDISEVMKWIKPNVSVVTKLSKVPVHVEFFSSVEQVTKEKSYLVRSLKPGGVAVLNADDEDVVNFKELTKEKVIFFGASDISNVKVHDYEVTYNEEKKPDGIKFIVSHALDEEGNIEEFPILLKGTLGYHLVYPILAALTVTDALGENVLQAGKAFRTHEPTPGRMRIIDGINSSVLIDDTYNSSPVAVEEALRTLKNVEGTRKVAVLGDMLELGKYSIEEHKKAGVIVSKTADVLITVGQRSQYTAESARENGFNTAYSFSRSEEAGDFLKDFIQAGDIVLIKGSQGIKAERIVERVMAHPEDKEKLLVRQDKEWQNRK